MRRIMTNRRGGLNAGFAVALLVGSSTLAAAQEQSFKFGLAMPLTGAQALYGQDQVKAAEWAVDEINKAAASTARSSR